MIEVTELAETILDNVHDGVYCVDLDRRIERWNQAAEDITGFSASEVVGSCCADNILNHVDSDGRLLCKTGCPLSATMADEQCREASVFLHHKDGHRLPVTVRALPMRNDQGKVIGAVEMFAPATERSALEQRLQELQALALVDELTALPNRRYIQRELDRRFEEYQRYTYSYAVLIGDIDNFKTVNDTHGHMAGDQVLKMVAASLQSNCRSFDAVGRWGGEEFMIILRNVDAGTTRTLAERFRILVEQSFVDHQQSSLSVTISIGGAVIQKDDTLATLIERADQQLYLSKESGRNQVSVSDTSSFTDSRETLTP